MGTPVYIDSNATGVNDGTSWVNAYATQQLAHTSYSPGDESWVAHNHNEAPGANLDWTKDADNTLLQKIPIYRVNSGTDVYSPTTGADTIQADVSGGDYDIICRPHTAQHGIHYAVGDDFTITSNSDFIDCYFTLAGSFSRFFFGSSSANTPVIVKNSTIDFTHANGGVIYCAGGRIDLEGCIFKGSPWSAGLLTGNTTGTKIFNLIGCDLSGFPSGETLIDGSGFGEAGWHVRVINCDLSASLNWTDGVFANDMQVLEVFGSDTGGNLYTSRRENLRGTVTEDTSVYRDAGYQDADGSTSLSMKMETRAATTEPHTPLESVALGEYYLSTGSTTFTIECLENFTTPLTKRQAWLELYYLGSASETLWSLDDSSREKIATSYTNLAAGTGLANWTGEPGGSRSVKLSVTVTVNQAGMYMLKLFLGAYESGKVFHYCPDPVVT